MGILICKRRNRQQRQRHAQREQDCHPLVFCGSCFHWFTPFCGCPRNQTLIRVHVPFSSPPLHILLPSYSPMYFLHWFGWTGGNLKILHYSDFTLSLYHVPLCYFSALSEVSIASLGIIRCYALSTGKGIRYPITEQTRLERRQSDFLKNQTIAA